MEIRLRLLHQVIGLSRHRSSLPRSGASFDWWGNNVHQMHRVFFRGGVCHQYLRRTERCFGLLGPIKGNHHEGRLRKWAGCVKRHGRGAWPMQDQNRHRGMANDVLGHTTERQAAETRAPMTAHDHQVHVLGLTVSRMPCATAPQSARAATGSPARSGWRAR